MRRNCIWIEGERVMTKEFDKKQDHITNTYMSPEEKEVVDAWYGFEEQDDDISTEKLVAMVMDETGYDCDFIIDSMSFFSEKYNELYGEE